MALFDKYIVNQAIYIMIKYIRLIIEDCYKFIVYKNCNYKEMWEIKY